MTIHETPTERDHRLDVERQARELGRDLAKQCPPGIGFALLLFDLGPDGTMAYMSNGKREDMIVALKELLGQLNRGQG